MLRSVSPIRSRGLAGRSARGEGTQLQSRRLACFSKQVRALPWRRQTKGRSRSALQDDNSQGRRNGTGYRARFEQDQSLVGNGVQGQDAAKQGKAQHCGKRVGEGLD